MREIIGMELHGKHNKWIETSLPLTDYELLDVIECLGVKPGEPFKVKFAVTMSNLSAYLAQCVPIFHWSNLMFWRANWRS